MNPCARGCVQRESAPQGRAAARAHLQRLYVVHLLRVHRARDERVELRVDDVQVGVELAQARHELLRQRKVPVRQVERAAVLLQGQRQSSV